MADQLFLRKQQTRKEKISKEINLRSDTWLLVCEGTKTEPKYFTCLFEYINSKTDKTIKFNVEGTGKNTESLVDSIDEFFSYIDDLKLKKTIPYGKVFAIFDKDSFKDEQFNNG